MSSSAKFEYKFPIPAAYLIKEINNLYHKVVFICLAVTLPVVVWGALTFVPLFASIYTESSKTPFWFHIMSGLILALVGGLIALGVCCSFVPNLVFNRLNTKLREAVRTNFVDFEKTIKTKFNISIDSTKLSFTSDGSVQRIMSGNIDNSSLEFKDSDGNLFYLTPVSRKKEVFNVIFYDKDAEIKSKAKIAKSLIVLSSGFRVKDVKSNLKVGKSFEQLLASETVQGDVKSAANNIQTILTTLGSLGLSDGQKAGVRNIQDELNELSGMFLKVVSVNVDSEFEGLIVSGFEQLESQLLAVRDEFVAEVKGEVSKKLELFDVLFAEVN